MFDLRARLACFAAASAFASGCGSVRVERAPRVVAVAASPVSESVPTSVAPPLEPRRQLLLPAKQDPAMESFFRSHTSSPARSFSAESPASLTAMAVFATGHAEARNLAPDPTFYGVTLAEGERAELALTPLPSCVTVVAHGGLGVMEIDSFIVDGAADSPRVLAADDRAGPMAVLGGQGMCAALAVSPGTRVVVIVRKGGGPVVMGVFRGDRSP